MKLSNFIENLKEILEREGDRNIFMLVDSGEDTTYAVEVPNLEYEDIGNEDVCEDWDLHTKCMNSLLITNLFSSKFDEDKVGLHYEK